MTDKGYSPKEVFTNPVSEELKEELKNWDVVTFYDDDDNVVLTLKLGEEES